MLTSQDVNLIGQITDSSWGSASTNDSTFQVPDGRSIKANLVNDENLLVKYVTIINFGDNLQAMHDPNYRPRKDAEGEANKLVKDYIKNLKSDFKRGSDGRSLKLKELSNDDSVELINYNPHSPHKTVYFRKNVILKVSI